MRIIPRLEKSESLVTHARTLGGQAVISVIASTLLWALNYRFFWIAGLVGLASGQFPRRRKEIFALGTFFGLLLAFDRRIDRTYLGPLNHISPALRFEMSSIAPLVLAFVAVYCFFAGFLALRKHWGYLNRRPVLTHMMILAGVIIFASYAKLPETVSFYLWMVILVWMALTWYFNYTLLARREYTLRGLILEFGFYVQYMNPIRGFPKGKGWAYLEKFDADEGARLAQSQLKGLKLIIWACILTWVKSSLDYVAFKNGQALIFSALGWSFQFPDIYTTFGAASSGAPMPWYWGWTSLLLYFPLRMLEIAIPGHIAVGCIRLSGFLIPRNTWRPLEALTLSEFWNRYYFYFKELLVDVFFYPTFARYFKANVKLRTFVATLSAAWIGNFTVHFFLFGYELPGLGFFGLLFKLHTFFFYAFVVGVGIGISQLRILNGRKLPEGLVHRTFARCCVYLFFAVTAILNDMWCTGDITDNFKFIFSLFGL